MSVVFLEIEDDHPCDRKITSVAACPARIVPLGHQTSASEDGPPGDNADDRSGDSGEDDGFASLPTIEKIRPPRRSSTSVGTHMIDEIAVELAPVADEHHSESGEESLASSSTEDGGDEGFRVGDEPATDLPEKARGVRRCPSAGRLARCR